MAAQIAQRKITSVQNELGHAISAETAQNALIQGFTATLKINLENGSLTQYEKALANKLYKEKYSSSLWNNMGKLTSSQDAT